MSTPHARAGQRRPGDRQRPRDQAADHRARHGRLASRSTTTARSRVTVLLTVAGCPLKDTITRDVTAAVAAVDGVTGVDLDARRDDRRAARRAQGARSAAARPSARSRSPSPARSPRCSRSPAARAASASRRSRSTWRSRWPSRACKVGIVDADIYGHSVPAMLGRRRLPADPGRRPDHAGADRERRLGDLDRHAQAAPRPGRRLARPDARPGPGPDAVRRLLGRPRRAAARPAARHRRHGDLARPAPARAPRSSSSPRRRRPRPRSPSAPARWPR